MKKTLLVLSFLFACCGYDDSGVDAAIENAAVETVQKPLWQACGSGGVPYGWIRLKNACFECWEISAGTNVSNFADWPSYQGNCGTWNDKVDDIETGGNASFRVYKHSNYGTQYFSGSEYWHFWSLYWDGYQISSLKTYASPTPQ